MVQSLVNAHDQGHPVKDVLLARAAAHRSAPQSKEFGKRPSRGSSGPALFHNVRRDEGQVDAHALLFSGYQHVRGGELALVEALDEVLAIIVGAASQARVLTGLEGKAGAGTCRKSKWMLKCSKP